MGIRGRSPLMTGCLLGCYGRIFHRTGNSVQLCQNFRILGGGGFDPLVRHWIQQYGGILSANIAGACT
jgi:hypothetical protein